MNGTNFGEQSTGIERLKNSILSPLRKIPLDENRISLTLILSVFLFALVWYSLVTNSSNNIGGFIGKTFQNMGQLFNQDAHMGQTSFADQFNLFYTPNVQEHFSNYVDNVTKIYSDDPYVLQYPQNIRDKYPVSIVRIENLPLHVSKQIETWANLISQADMAIVKLFILIGISSFIVFIKGRETIGLEYSSLIIASLAIVLLIILIPYGTIDYSLMRTYTQLLICLSLPAITGAFLVFSLFKERMRVVLVMAIFLLCFVSYSGFIGQLVGGGVGDLHLNNVGLYYDYYLNHRQELLAGSWLNKNYDHANYIYTDDINSYKLVAFSGFDGSGFKLDVLPATIDQNAYVFMSYTNVVKHEMIKYYNGEFILYSYPTEFIGDNKNLIYNNGGSEIYK